MAVVEPGSVSVRLPHVVADIVRARVCVLAWRRVGSGREQHMRDPIELDLDCGLLIFEDGEWRLRKPSSAAVCSNRNGRALTYRLCVRRRWGCGCQGR